jgi:energy-coupling factor transport system permease protein
MSNIILGKYIPIKSKIHSMNSISKIICLLLFTILLFINNNLSLLLWLILLTALSMVLSKVPIKLYLKAISSLKILIIFIVIITLIFNGSWYQTIVSVIKIILGILYAMVLTYTTSKSELTYGLEQVFLPLQVIKFPVKKIALLITLALRFIPNIFEQINKIMKSQASRGIDFKYANLKGKITAISSMIVPMFILTTTKADSVADAMEVRMYDYNAKRTSYRHHRWTNFEENTIMLHLGLFLFFVLRSILV